MNAREIFKIGQRVKLSADGIHHFRYGNAPNARARHDANLRGTVRGFGQSADALRVQRDGIKGADSYAMRFWEAE